ELNEGVAAKFGKQSPFDFRVRLGVGLGVCSAAGQAAGWVCGSASGQAAGWVCGSASGQSVGSARGSVSGQAAGSVCGSASPAGVAALSTGER
ncbi:hypothetical protein ACWIF2_38640, partial [Streptomyces sp. NPDC055506]